MKEHPILFSGAMVRAILEGRKTQTRRATGLDMVNVSPDDWTITWQGLVSDGNIGAQFDRRRESEFLTCEYGGPGDRLWVKETWATAAAWDKQKPSDLSKTTPIYYHADKSHGSLVRWYDEDEERGRLRPSIFMCRWISRITMEITGVRVERLNDISERDAIAEGVERDAICGPCSWYQMLWENINGKGSWVKNPWVWVVEFQRLNSKG